MNSNTLPPPEEGVEMTRKDEESTLKLVMLFTDGSCLGNPGPGGWACILRYKDRERTLQEESSTQRATAWSSWQRFAACAA